MNGVQTARSAVHADARGAMVILGLDMVRLAAKTHPNLQEIPCLFRAAKHLVTDLDLKDSASILT